MEEILSQIKPGREGWVYLIHAVGTDRYKIGRSVNPVSRLETLKGQSPYPLQIVDCFWSIDAVEDERRAHVNLVEHRVHGEWFEFTEFGNDGKRWTGTLKKAKDCLFLDRLIEDFKREGYKSVCSFLGIEDSDEVCCYLFDVHILYDLAQSGGELIKIQDFIHLSLPCLINEFLENGMKGISTREILSFVCGSIRSFAVSVLNKKLHC